MSKEVEEIKAVVETLSRSLVDDPSQVKVECSQVDGMLCVFLKVADNDISKVIGKKGQTIETLRYFIRLIGSKYKIRTTIIIKEK